MVSRTRSDFDGGVRYAGATRLRLALVLFALGVLEFATGAVAESHEVGEDAAAGESHATEESHEASESAESRPAASLEDPEESRLQARAEVADDLMRDKRFGVLHEPWHYSNDYFFILTRNLKHEKVWRGFRTVSWALLLPFDIGMLPTAAVAGLFG